ncbi:Imm32 family immunity protein [Nocardia jiangsuensis]|uniref:Uncharacterized protein n=1 Tax=Nocardia jiangsuensis TaxID=1691563 RepID=A0ABV8DXR2_9NOCA
MIWTIDAPEYDETGGVRMEWEAGFSILVQNHGPEILIQANRAGLISLARILLTLAGTTTPAGAHVHLTGGQEIDTDLGLVVDRLED